MTALQKPNLTITCSPNVFYVLSFLCILYATTSLTSAVLVNRLIQLGPLLLPGGIFVFPVSYVITDMVAELFGVHIAKKMILALVLCSLFFAFILFLVIHLPYPSDWHLDSSYREVFDSSIRLVLFGVFANYLGSWCNASVVVRLRLYTKGKYFAIRSIIASGLGELILTLIVYFGVYWTTSAISGILQLVLDGYLIKLLYSMLLAFPSQFIISYLRHRGFYMSPADSVSRNPFAVTDE